MPLLAKLREFEGGGRGEGLEQTFECDIIYGECVTRVQFALAHACALAFNERQ